MKLVLLLSALASAASAFPARPVAPYNPAPAPYAPAPHPAHGGAYRDPYYEDTPVVLCEHYPYCNDAPYQLPYLQDEINALRVRNAQIVAAGERLAQQLPNRPFVGGYGNL